MYEYALIRSGVIFAHFTPRTARPEGSEATEAASNVSFMRHIEQNNRQTSSDMVSIQTVLSLHEDARPCHATAYRPYTFWSHFCPLSSKNGAARRERSDRGCIQCKSSMWHLEQKR